MCVSVQNKQKWNNRKKFLFTKKKQQQQQERAPELIMKEWKKKNVNDCRY